MADLQPNFDLEDALTDQPPDMEPEIKRDFISSLEAEPYDDVVGESCGKTDYIPLLDDDEAKAGSQEPKSKYHADGSLVECTAGGQRAVLENGDHEIGENDTTGSFEVIVDEKPYSEFMPHQDHWPQEEQFGFEPQPVFQLINQPNTFDLNTEDDYRKTRPAFTKNFGTSEEITGAVVPEEECLLDATYAPAEIDTAALVSQDPVSEAQLIAAATTEEAAFEADWLEAQRRHVEGAETLIEEASETVTVTPGETPSEESLKETSFFPMEPMKDGHTAMVWQPTEQEQLALDRHHIPEPPRKAEEAEFILPEAFTTVAAEMEFTEETKAAGVQPTKLIETSLLIEYNEPVSEYVASDAAAVPVEQETTERQPDVQPTQEFSEEGRVEVAETPAPVEPSAPPFDLLTEIPPAMKHHVEPQEPEVTIATEVSLLETAAALPATEDTIPKEEREADIVRHEESAQESAASLRQAYKPSDRRFDRTKPATLPVPQALEELPVGPLQPKSLDPTLEVESGSVAAMASRTKALHKKAAELAEMRREVKDTWDPEGAPTVMKKKKRKPKQKRSMQPRAVEQFGNFGSSTELVTPWSAVEVQKSDISFGLSAETEREHTPSSSKCWDMGIVDDPKQITVIDVQNSPSTAYPLKSKDLIILTEDSNTGVKEDKGEVRKDLLALQSESKLSLKTEDLLQGNGDKTKSEVLTITHTGAKPEGTSLKGKSKRSSECKTAVSEDMMKGAEVSSETKAEERFFFDKDIHQFTLSTYPVQMEITEKQANFNVSESNRTEGINVCPVKFDLNQNIELPAPDQPILIEMELPKIQVAGGGGKASKFKKSRTTDKRKKIECLETTMDVLQAPAVMGTKDRAKELGFVDLSPDVHDISKQQVILQDKEGILGTCIMPIPEADAKTAKTKIDNSFMECIVKSEKDEPIVALVDNKIKPVSHDKGNVGISAVVEAVNVEKANTTKIQVSSFGELGGATKDTKEMDLHLEQLISEADKVQIQASSSTEEKDKVLVSDTGKDFSNIPLDKPLKTKTNVIDVQIVNASSVENRAKEAGFFGSKKTQRGSLKRPHSFNNKAVKTPSVGSLESKVKDESLSCENKEIGLSLEPLPFLGKKVEGPSRAHRNKSKETDGADTGDVGFKRNVVEFECKKAQSEGGEPLASLDIALNKYRVSTESTDYGKISAVDLTDTSMANKLSPMESSTSIEIIRNASKTFTLPSESPKAIDEIKVTEFTSEPSTNYNVEFQAHKAHVPKIFPVASIEDKTKPDLSVNNTVKLASVDLATLEKKADAPSVAPMEDKTKPGLIEDKAVKLVFTEHPATIEMKADAPKVPSVAPVKDKARSAGIEDKAVILVSTEHPATLEMKADAPKVPSLAPVKEKARSAGIEDKAVKLGSTEHPATLEMKADAPKVPSLAPVKDKARSAGIEDKAVKLGSTVHPATLEMKADAPKVPSVAPVKDKARSAGIEDKAVILVSTDHPATLEMKADAPKVPSLAPVKEKARSAGIEDKAVKLGSTEHPATLEMKADAPKVPSLAPVKDKARSAGIEDKAVKLGSTEHPAILEMKADAPKVPSLAPVKDKARSAAIEDKAVILVSTEHPATLEMKADAPKVPSLAPVKEKARSAGIEDKAVKLGSTEHPATLEMKADAPKVPSLAPVKDKARSAGIEDKAVKLGSTEHPAILEMKADAPKVPSVAQVKDKAKPAGIEDKAVTVEHIATLGMKADAPKVPSVAPVKDKAKLGHGEDNLEHLAILEIKADAPRFPSVATVENKTNLDGTEDTAVSVEHRATLEMKADASKVPSIALAEDKTKISIEKTSGVDLERSINLENKVDFCGSAMPPVNEKREETSLKIKTEYISCENSELRAPSLMSTGREIKATLDKDLESELNLMQGLPLTLEETDEFKQKGVMKEQTSEKKTRAPEQIKGYMRPTKSRGATPSLMKSAVPDGEKSKQPKDSNLNRQRQEKGKTEASQAHDGTAGVDITAPPNKELPPSPEKKTKPSAVTPSAKPAIAKSKPLSTSSPKRPASATTPAQNKKTASPAASGPATSSTPKRPLTSTTRLSATPRDLKVKSVDAKSPLKSPEKRTAVSKTPTTTAAGTSIKASPVTPRIPASTSVDASNSLTGSGQKTTTASTPKRPTAIKNDVKSADTKKSSSTVKSTAAELSRPKTSPVNSSRSTASAAAAPGGISSTAAAPSRPKPVKQAPAKPATNSTTDTKKLSTVKAPPPKPSTVPKQTRPASAPASDLKNVRSKIGSVDNMKHQPGGGKAKVTKPEKADPARKFEPLPVTRIAAVKTAVTKKHAQNQTSGKAKVAKVESADPACKSEPLPVTRTAAVKTAVSKESALKQTDGKVQIVSKKVNYSHVQSKCGSKDNIKHVPGGGNILIQNKKVDMSKVSSKCGSKANIKHKPGGGDVKIESHKINLKGKVQSKVGSLDNVGHVPAGGNVKTEGSEEAGELAQTPENGDLAAPQGLTGSEMRENGVGEETVPAEGGDQREVQSFSTQIQETN
uniref:Microtubule-associated protein n=1 Tax=Geotrypetes seraphini TaxID=260995 RepID=A0A6P8PZA8_GEOSA|nr:microtubule-associated protein 4 isoform X2 [Geotrypetes seraphini]